MLIISIGITGQNLFFGASGDIEVHGTIQASGELGLKSSDGDIKLSADNWTLDKLPLDLEIKCVPITRNLH